MIFKIFMAIGLVVFLNGCFTVVSDTELTLNNVTQEQYVQIRDDMRNILTNLKPPFDCESDDEIWKDDRANGKLICDSGNLQIMMKDNKVSITYSVAPAFWIPTKEIITEEHEKVQKLFVNLADKYKKQYPHATIEVIFYHQDIVGGSRKLFSK